jgi:hypothetical protein
VDPISAFALVTGAIQGVKTLCATVREAKEAGQEVINLTGEVTGFISQVLEGTDKLQKAEQEIRTNPPKNKSLQVLAFEEEMRKLELKQHYEDLRNMIIYELGLPGGFWADFQNTLHRMEREDAEAKAQAELLRKQAEWRREQIRRNVENNLLVTAAMLVVAIYLGALMWAISLHRENQLPLPWGS